MSATKLRHLNASHSHTISTRFALGLLHSPLRFLLEPGIAEVAYTGRRTGHSFRLAVMYARYGQQVTIVARRGHRKTWWRNFTTPQPMRIALGGESWKAIAVVAKPGTPAFTEALTRYRQRFPKVHFRPGDQLIIVTLDAPG